MNWPLMLQNVIRAYNKMHVKYKMRMEWGIGGLKKNGNNQ